MREFSYAYNLVTVRSDLTNIEERHLKWKHTLERTKVNVRKIKAMKVGTKLRQDILRTIDSCKRVMEIKLYLVLNLQILGT